MSDDLDAVARDLYRHPPEEFLAARAQAAAAAEPARAKQIKALRKPTVAAWAVNTAVAADDGLVPRLRALGDDLRAAQSDLAAGRLRDLAGDRRVLVLHATRDALAGIGRADPPAGLRDEISNTFEAALADPEVLGRLGRLARSEVWSGFGFAGDPPALTVVPGGRSNSAAPAEQKRSDSAMTAARRRALDKADRDLERVELELHAATERERQAREDLRECERHLQDLQRGLADARSTYEQAHEAAGAARKAHRKAKLIRQRAGRGE